MRKILVTSALPYVNNIPHLGNLIGATLSADVYSRHARLTGTEVLFVCGADDHGTATETKAKEENTTPEELCARYGKIHKEIYDWFNISFDIWGRTHTDTHAKITQEIFLKLHQNGFIKEQEVEQLFDEEANQFLADRFVEGICPHCKASGARGDQCDSCQNLINAVELIEPVSKITGATPIIKKAKHLFIDLPALRSQLDPWLEKASERWTKNTVKITENWLKDLRERAITRDLSWGIPVPLEGYENKVFYVWFDAPIGYISITAHDNENWKDWWLNEETDLVQFMGKDNVVFHSVIFPSCLLGTKDPYTLVDKISTTEFLNMENTKFSKSQHTGVFGDDCIQLEKEFGIPVDVWRYYLLSIRPETADTTFSWSDFQEKTNNELIANLGNLVHRTLHFAKKNCKSLGQVDEDFISKIKASTDIINSFLHAAQLKPALQEIMLLSKLGNQYFQENEPWRVIKEDEEKAHSTILTLLTLIKDLSIVISPFLPSTAEYVQSTLQLNDLNYENINESLTNDIFNNIQEPKILFNKIEDETIQELEVRFSGAPSLDLRVAKVVAAKNHPDADKLLILNVELDNEERQIVAGLAQHYSLDELEGKHIVIVYNLEHAKLRGEMSEGMLLAGEKDDVVGLLITNAKPGTRLSIGGKFSNTEKVSFDDFTKIKLEATESGVTCNGQPLEGAEFSVDRAAYGRLR